MSTPTGLTRIDRIENSVDQVGNNIIINGGIDFTQRGNTFGISPAPNVTESAYPADRVKTVYTRGAGSGSAGFRTTVPTDVPAELLGNAAASVRINSISSGLVNLESRVQPFQWVVEGNIAMGIKPGDTVYIQFHFKSHINGNFLLRLVETNVGGTINNKYGTLFQYTGSGAYQKIQIAITLPLDFSFAYDTGRGLTFEIANIAGLTSTLYNFPALNTWTQVASDFTSHPSAVNWARGFGAANNEVTSVAIQTDGKVIVAGNFTIFGGQTRNRIVRLNPDGSEDTDFYTATGGGAGAIIESVAIQSDGKIIVAGNFTTFGGQTRNRIVRLNTDGSEDTLFYSATNGGAGAVINSAFVQADGKILLGGDFTTFGGQTRNRIVRLNTTGAEDTAFYTATNGGAGAAINTITTQADGFILIGGAFTSFGGQTRNRIVRLNTTGAEDTAFYTATNGGAGAAVNTITVQLDQRILVGGAFISFGGQTRNRIVRLNTTGSEDTAFYTATGGGAGAAVNVIRVQTDQKILVGGAFSIFGGVTRNYIVRLNSTGSEDTAFYTATNGGVGADVNTIALQADNKIVIGGLFVGVGTQSREFIARLESTGAQEEYYVQMTGLKVNNRGFEDFSRAGGDYATELRLCQRYYEKSYNLSTNPGLPQLAGSSGGYFARQSTAGIFVTRFITRKRATPSVFVYNPVNGNINAIVAFPTTQLNINSVSTTESAFDVVAADSAAAASLGWHWTADADF